MMAAVLDQSRFESLANPAPPEGASITPPHSTNGKGGGSDGAPSELSDMEIDPKPEAQPDAAPEEVEEIEPDHFYGDGKIPVFKPVSCLSQQGIIRGGLSRVESC